MQDRTLQKVSTFIEVCKSIQSLSYDTKYKVGCIIIEKDFTRINSIGYNGNYRNGPNERDSNESGKSGFIHAELNALLKLKHDPDDQLLICTWTPCSHCAKCIVNSGIKRCLFISDYKDRQFEHIFRDGGVKYVVVNDLLDTLGEDIKQLLS